MPSLPGPSAPAPAPAGAPGLLHAPLITLPDRVPLSRAPLQVRVAAGSPALRGARRAAAGEVPVVIVGPGDEGGPAPLGRMARVLGVEPVGDEDDDIVAFDLRLAPEGRVAVLEVREVGGAPQCDALAMPLPGGDVPPAALDRLRAAALGHLEATGAAPSVAGLLDRADVGAAELADALSAAVPGGLAARQALLASADLPALVAGLTQAFLEARAEALREKARPADEGPVAPEDEPGPMPDELAGACRWTARQILRAGMVPADPAAVAELVCDELGLELDEGDEAERLQRTCLDEILARRAEEAAWPAETDVDRLLKAFAVLGRQGVLCLEDSGQDADDLRALADDELQRRRAQGEPLLGWLGSTSTDVRAAAAGHGLLLHVGADDPSGALAVARAAVVALEAAGLDVRWAGRIDEVLRVRLRWLRRMPPGATPLSQH
jgi:hypothetical protein